MKKTVFILGLLFGIVFSGGAQVNPHAIGLRSGGGANGYGFGNEISYQQGMGDANRVELDLGFRSYKYRGYGNSRSSSFSFTGVYHWVFNLEDKLNWYVGPGIQIGNTNEQIYTSSVYGYNKVVSYSAGFLGVGGQLGLEYDFNGLDVPILVSLDIRPMFYLGDLVSRFISDLALSIRYTF